MVATYINYFSIPIWFYWRDVWSYYNDCNTSITKILWKALPSFEPFNKEAQKDAILEFKNVKLNPKNIYTKEDYDEKDI